MKILLLSLLLCAVVLYAEAQPETNFNDTAYLQPVEVLAIRAADNAPFAKTTITQKDIEKINLGQDLPFLLNQLPSMVVSADAGNGVGYTGFRIRGSDATRINMTINGIPYNDAESQGLFLVNIPDIASSANSIQVQRGVGTSTNGASSFGGTINLSTNELNKQTFAEMNNSYGSFNTWKNTFRFASGLIGKHFSIDARLSNISSDGYIDRAKTALRSAYLSTAWTNQKNSFRFNIISGKEKTYQAWNGLPEELLNSARTYNSSGTEQPGMPYENETDNYSQTHYQFFYNHQFNPYWKTNAAVFLTKGKGYYEQYKAGQTLTDYGLINYFDGTNVIEETDIIRQLWLDNSFYGTTFSVQHQKHRTSFIGGGGWNHYNGQHFGKIIWAKVKPAVPSNYRWYDLDADKSDFSLYSKWTEQWSNTWQSFIDVQFRSVRYNLNGFRNNPMLISNNSYNFLNPKIGVSFTKNQWHGYASVAVANKEPNRDDFEAGTLVQPKAEQLTDLEIGIEKKTRTAFYSANIYWMQYSNQLVLVGNINDVGAYTRTNVPNSYRIGIELQGKLKLSEQINFSGNITLSSNRIKNFTEKIDDFDNGGTKNNFYASTQIAFSPGVTGAGSINITPFKNAEINLLSKYVSRQYLDNTSQLTRSINAYYLQDVRLSYLLTEKFFKATTLIVQLNNVFNKKYEANGFTFSYVAAGETTTENFFYPMAPFNFMVGINIKL